MSTITRLGLLATAGAALALSSCATGGKSPSGFLSNYKQMDGGYGTANAVSVYVKPGADLKKYDNVIIDPVTTIVAAPGISPQVQEQIAAYLRDSLHIQSEGRLKTTNVPGPTTLRIRAALTDVLEGQKTGKPVTTVHPGAHATLSGSLGSAEVAAFISNVVLEGEIVDSMTGERLVASSDQRLGSKREATPKTSWEGVRSGVNQGVGRLYERFMTVRGN